MKSLIVQEEIIKEDSGIQRPAVEVEDSGARVLERGGLRLGTVVFALDSLRWTRRWFGLRELSNPVSAAMIPDVSGRDGNGDRRCRLPQRGKELGKFLGDGI